MRSFDPSIVTAIISLIGVLIVSLITVSHVQYYFENRQPEIQDLNTNPSSPQAAFSVITWNATANDHEGDPIYYDFFLKGPSTNEKLREMTGWTSSPNWTWTTSDSDAGENIILVKVNDLNHINLNYSAQKDKKMIIYMQPFSQDRNLKCENLFTQGRYQYAMDCCNESIKLNPRDSTAWYYEGMTLFNLSRISEAIKCFDKAIKVNNLSDDTWDEEGIAFAAMGNYTQAIYCYEKAIQINSSVGVYRYNNGLSLEALGDDKDAKINFDMACKLGYYCPAI